MGLQVGYIHQKKAEIIQKLFYNEMFRLIEEKTQKKRIFWFLTQNREGLDTFFAEFLKMFNDKSKVWLHWDVLKSPT